MSEKLNEVIVRDLLKVKDDGNLYHRESQLLEFKESFNFSGLAEYYRDFSAFANNKGGYLIFGIKDRPRRELIGLKEKAIEQFDKLDPEQISGHLLDLFSPDICWEHEIFTIGNLTFGVFYTYEATVKPVICKKDEGKDNTLKNGEIYYRYGGRTQKIQFAELENIIIKRIVHNNNQWMDLVQKIGKSGPNNAAILDTERDIIEKNESQVLVVDEKLVKEIQWIREGEFVEKKGERTLKLLGSVSPIDQVEVIKRVKENRLKEYPLSAKELVAEIKKKKPEIKLNEIYSIISENDIKKNTDYSTYVFRNKSQESWYENNGVIAQGVPSIYKPSTVDFIINIFQNENNTKN